MFKINHVVKKCAIYIDENIHTQGITFSLSITFLF
jgi:hypothetical protein